MAGKTLACPCCDGPLTAEKLARLLSDVQRLAATASDQPGQASNGAGRYAGMIIDSHAHMISRTTDDYEAMAKAGVVAVIEPPSGLDNPAQMSEAMSTTLP
jgi:Predicted metal-dependent hydrolases with the TIM-barrel fold